ncbi:amino acid adenylation domain-containing protein [Paenibacillus thiaminolyticus]|uniref:amino acid adenylation domain-containing protein n=1 Tax=Paenibacillus thiaminolyticus TaxID=49283 RepID=UPI003D297B92
MYGASGSMSDHPFPLEETLPIHQLFEQQVKLYPDQPAIVYQDQSFTYSEINRKANQLAHALMANQAPSGTVVAVVLERSVEMVISILAVLKAGGCYLAIDTDYPAERIQYMLSDSRASVMISTRRASEGIVFAGKHLFVEDPQLKNYGEDNPAAQVQATDLAYLIYTSGTTGAPKGVMVEHKGIANLKLLWQEAFGIHVHDRIGQFASISFDASAWEIFMGLLNGAALYLLTREVILDQRLFQAYLRNNGVTVMTLPPAYALYLEPDSLPALRLLITAGSASSMDLVNRWSGKVTYINAYGPTETTICATIWQAPKEGSSAHLVPIGKPIANTEIYILDDHRQLVKAGEIGEIYIGGIGLARGYLGRPSLTRDCFVDHPFAPGLKLYRTGDYARWLPDGNIEYHGRADRQVKIRGHRVELGEIEAVLQRHKGISESTVLARQDRHGDSYLVAYYVSPQEIPPEELSSSIEKTVPRYMVPKHFCWLQAMPLTINGKIDFAQLPEIDEKPHRGNDEAPPNEREKLVAEVWQEVLGIEEIGMNDSFYMLGGDSIKAIQTAARLYERNMAMRVKDLMLHSTIKALAPLIVPVAREPEQCIIHGEVQLSPAQCWFFENRFSAMHHFNQSVLLYNPEGYDLEGLQKAIVRLVEHHDALRMKYELEHEPPLQMNRGMEDDVYTFDLYDLSLQKNEEIYIQQCIEKLQSSIRLDKGPLIRAALFRSSQGDHLFLAVHHLVIDGVSFRILLEDLAKAYEQAVRGTEIKLPNKSDSYQTWTNELHRYAASPGLLNEIPFWLEMERKARQVPLPRKQQIREKYFKDKRVIRLRVDPEHTRMLLQDVHQAFHTEINDILLTALGLTFRSGEIQVQVHVEAHGREDIIKGLNVSRTIGWFTSQYPVLLEMSNPEDLSLQIKLVKETLRKIPNKGVGYQILQYITPDHLCSELAFHMKPDICFNYLGQLDYGSACFAQSPYGSGASLGPEGEGNVGMANEIYSPITFIGYVQQGMLHFSISYHKLEFDQAFMEDAAREFEHHLLALIQHCMQQKSVEKTPSDFSCPGLEQTEVEKVYRLLEKSR